MLPAACEGPCGYQDGSQDPSLWASCCYYTQYSDVEAESLSQGRSRGWGIRGHLYGGEPCGSLWAPANQKLQALRREG